MLCLSKMLKTDTANYFNPVVAVRTEFSGNFVLYLQKKSILLLLSLVLKSLELASKLGYIIWLKIHTTFSPHYLDVIKAKVCFLNQHKIYK